MVVHNVKIRDREEVADRTLAIRLERPDGFLYEAGQAIDVTLLGPTGDAGPRHLFSLVSAPYEDTLTFATRLRDSPFKNRLKTLRIGDPVRLEGPFGSLTLPPDRTRAIVLIAGGIGVTPFVSISRQAEHEHRDQRILILYSNRRPEDAAYLSELTKRAQRSPHIDLVATMTGMERSTRRWDGERSRVDAALLARLTKGFPHALYFIAGPPGMVDAIQQAVQRLGVADDAIRSEEFFGY